MGELGSGEVYAPPRTIQAWKTILNWLSFFFHIFLQIIIKASPSNFSQLLSTTSFKPLPDVELSELTQDDAPPTATVTVSDYGGGRQWPSEKLTVVLDLDETLVCAYETSSLPAILREQATEAGLKWFELECISSDKEIEGKPKVNYVTVFERPGLREFLKELSEFADLVLFTAGLEGYARPLVDRIDDINCLSRRLYRPSTISTFPSHAYRDLLYGNNQLRIFKGTYLVLPIFSKEYREHVKDLSCISKDFCRIVIVDNNPFSFLLQPVNGIPCIPFSAGQPHDEQLLQVLLPLLKHLSQQQDVRPVLYERFRMPEWFQKHGIPASGPGLRIT